MHAPPINLKSRLFSVIIIICVCAVKPIKNTRKRQPTDNAAAG